MQAISQKIENDKQQLIKQKPDWSWYSHTKPNSNKKNELVDKDQILANYKYKYWEGVSKDDLNTSESSPLLITICKKIIHGNYFPYCFRMSMIQLPLTLTR